jgi:hypothetical protein
MFPHDFSSLHIRGNYNFSSPLRGAPPVIPRAGGESRLFTPSKFIIPCSKFNIHSPPFVWEDHKLSPPLLGEEKGGVSV